MSEDDNSYSSGQFSQKPSWQFPLGSQAWQAAKDREANQQSNDVISARQNAENWRQVGEALAKLPEPARSIISTVIVTAVLTYMGIYVVADHIKQPTGGMPSSNPLPLTGNQSAIWRASYKDASTEINKLNTDYFNGIYSRTGLVLNDQEVFSAPPGSDTSASSVGFLNKGQEVHTDGSMQYRNSNGVSTRWANIRIINADGQNVGGVIPAESLQIMGPNFKVGDLVEVNNSGADYYGQTVDSRGYLAWNSGHLPKGTYVLIRRIGASQFGDIYGEVKHFGSVTIHSQDVKPVALNLLSNQVPLTAQPVSPNRPASPYHFSFGFGQQNGPQ